MANFVAVYDACVLYPAGLRSLMMWLAVHGLIRPKWSEQIHEEWMRNVLKDRPDLTPAQLERTRRLMDEHGGDCLVTGYEQHIASLTLPDMDDRHVVAAGIEAGADAIITWNLCVHDQSQWLGAGARLSEPRKKRMRER